MICAAYLAMKLVQCSVLGIHHEKPFSECKQIFHDKERCFQGICLVHTCLFQTVVQMQPTVQSKTLQRWAADTRNLSHKGQRCVFCLLRSRVCQEIKNIMRDKSLAIKVTHATCGRFCTHPTLDFCSRGTTVLVTREHSPYSSNQDPKVETIGGIDSE